MKFKIILYLCATLLIGCSSNNHLATDNTTDKYAAIFKKLIYEERIPGIAVTVAKESGVIYSKGFGLANLENRVPVNPRETRFRIGSTSKSLTAYAVALLYEQGKLDLDVPIQNYVPGFPEKGKGKITPRLLAGHLAGIRHYKPGVVELGSQKQYDTVADGLNIFRDDPLISNPGDSFYYSSYGWNLLSAAVEGASNVPFLEFMWNEVFNPLGMDHTTADQMNQVVPNRTGFYYLNDRVVLNGPPINQSYKWAGGGFLSTSEDLAVFGVAHLRKKGLKKETVNILWESQVNSNGEKTNYGIGWFIGKDSDGRHWVQHPGGTVGGTAFFRIYPEEGLVVSILANLSSAPLNEAAEKLISYLFESEVGSDKANK